MSQAPAIASRSGSWWSRHRLNGVAPVVTAFALTLGLVLALALSGCGATSQAGIWQRLGQPQDGTVLCLARDPFNPRLIYAGTSRGIVARALVGHTIDPIAGNGLPLTAAVLALVPDPGLNGTVYAATTAGFYVTADNGETWQTRGSAFPIDDTMLALTIAPGRGELIAGSSAHGVYRSLDAGHTWVASSSGLPAATAVTALYWQEATSTLFAGLEHAGLYTSRNGGVSWVRTGVGLPPDIFAILSLPPGAGSATAATLVAGTGTGVYASTDDGAHWSATSHGLPQGRVLALATSATQSSVLYAGTAGDSGAVYRSTDRGATWAVLAPGLSQTVASVLSATSAGGSESVYAGGGQLAVYPPIPLAGSSTAGVIVDTLILLALMAVLVVVMLRQYRRHTENERAVERLISVRRRPHPTRDNPPSAHNGHARLPADGPLDEGWSAGGPPHPSEKREEPPR